MKKHKKEQYRFLRWLIICIVKTPRLYVLVWGIMLLLTAAILKTDVIRILGELLK